MEGEKKNSTKLNFSKELEGRRLSRALGLEPPDPPQDGGSGRELLGCGGPTRHGGTRGCFKPPRSFSPAQPPPITEVRAAGGGPGPRGTPTSSLSPEGPRPAFPSGNARGLPPGRTTPSVTRAPPAAPPAAWYAPAYLSAPSLHPPGGAAVPAPAASGWGGSHSLCLVFPLRLPSPAPPPPRPGAVGLFRKAGRSSTLNRWISHVFGHFRPKWRKLPK